MKNLSHLRGICFSVIFAMTCLLMSDHADAVNLDLERPGEREFIRDLADLIDPEGEQFANSTGELSEIIGSTDLNLT